MTARLVLVLGMIFLFTSGQSIANVNEVWLEVETDICNGEEINEVVKSGNYFNLDLAERTGCMGYYTKDSGPSWLTVEAKGEVKGTPNDSHEGYNDFYITCKPLSSETVDIKLTIYVDCGG